MTIKIKSSREFRAKIHNAFWLWKIVGLLGVLIGMFFVIVFDYFVTKFSPRNSEKKIFKTYFSNFSNMKYSNLFAIQNMNEDGFLLVWKYIGKVQYLIMFKVYINYIHLLSVLMGVIYYKLYYLIVY